MTAPQEGIKPPKKKRKQGRKNAVLDKPTREESARRREIAQQGAKPVVTEQ